ncbi:hypothetical protein OEB96_44355 [Paraliomyxa miuraensis]|nr:hypothetical protein [Paraliomyxa miuraensis]
MTKVCLLGPSADRDAAVRAVADAGVLHVLERRPAPELPTELKAQRERVERMLAALPPGDEDGPWPGAEAAAGELRRVERLVAACDEARATLERLEREHARARPWGGVEPEALERLGEAGVTVAVFEGRRSQLPADILAGFDWASVVPRPGGRVQLWVVTRGEVTLPLDRMEPPVRSLGVLRDDVRRARRVLAECLSERDEAVAVRPVLVGYRRWLDDELALATTAEGLGEGQPIFVLEGYCPTEGLERLRALRAERSLVLTTRSPAPDEAVPIALRNGPLVRTFEPLVAAFKLPRHDEIDPTPLVAPFMGVFFALCLGDLGYGILLTALAAGVLLRARLSGLRTRPSGSVRLLLQWALLLGVVSIAVGALLGNLFGVRIHELLGLSPSALLFSLVEDPSRLLMVSLGLGLVQLHLGMGLRLWLDLRRRRYQAALGSLAWLMVVPTLVPWVMGWWPGWSFGLVCVALLGFAVPVPNPWRRLGGGAWALYDIVSLLGNVASYMRLFGLGLSSGIIAMVVNTIAAVLMGGPVGTVAAVLVLVVGHAFNFAMALIGAMVHPARLQLLEFFNTFFAGGGRAYAPLRRTCQGE